MAIKLKRSYRFALRSSLFIASVFALVLGTLLFFFHTFDLLWNVSHELKTPLFTVQGYIETLLDGAMNDKNVRKKYLQRASKGVDRLIYILSLIHISEPT